MLATRYTYEVSAGDGPSVNIVLRRTEDGAEKHFFMANASVELMKKHMESMTDENCDCYFNRKKNKPNK